VTTGNDTYNRPLLLALAIAVGPACAHSPNVEPFSYEDRVAIAVGGTDKVCVSAKGDFFKPGDEVRLIDPGTQKSWLAIVEPVTEKCELSVSDVSMRAVRVGIKGEQPGPFVGVAIQPPRTSSFDVIDAVVSADLDGDGQREFFRSCTSVEGVHLTVWSGAPLTGQRRWHAYHYVGYDMVPSCTPGEIGG
jgi:hypothetical protein